MSETFKEFWIVWNKTQERAASNTEYETEKEANIAAQKFGIVGPQRRFVVMESKRMTEHPADYLWQLPEGEVQEGTDNAHESRCPRETTGRVGPSKVE